MAFSPRVDLLGLLVAVCRRAGCAPAPAPSLLVVMDFPDNFMAASCVMRCCKPPQKIYYGQDSWSSVEATSSGESINSIPSTLVIDGSIRSHDLIVRPFPDVPFLIFEKVPSLLDFKKVSRVNQT